MSGNEQEQVNASSVPRRTKSFFAIVRLKGWRCLAFRDEQGRWHDFYHPDEILLDVQAVEPV